MVDSLQDLGWLRDAHRRAVRRNEDARARQLLRSAITTDPAAARFVQREREYDLLQLVEHIRSDRPVELSLPLRAPLSWDEQRARLWACDCAERVLDCYEATLDDRRAHHAIAMARAFARGEVGPLELEDAHHQADEAARALVRIAHGTVTAAWVAAMAVKRCSATRDQWDAGRDAARLAARNAFWAREQESAEAGRAERAWQGDRLLDYLLGAL